MNSRSTNGRALAALLVGIVLGGTGVYFALVSDGVASDPVITKTILARSDSIVALRDSLDSSLEQVVTERQDQYDEIIKYTEHRRDSTVALTRPKRDSAVARILFRFSTHPD